MDIKIERKIKIEVETTAYVHDGKLKTHPCECGEWYGDDICEKINFNSEIEKLKLPEGEYKISLVLERV